MEFPKNLVNLSSTHSKWRFTLSSWELPKYTVMSVKHPSTEKRKQICLQKPNRFVLLSTPNWVNRVCLPFMLTLCGSLENFLSFFGTFMCSTRFNSVTLEAQCLSVNCGRREKDRQLGTEVCLWHCSSAPILQGYFCYFTSQELICQGPIINSTLLPRLILIMS
jgi:hypothetical protein